MRKLIMATIVLAAVACKMEKTDNGTYKVEGPTPEAREAAPPPLAWLRDKEPTLRQAAGQALKQIDPTAAARGGIR